MSDSTSVMPEHPPGHRLGARFRSLPIRAGPRIRFRSGRNCARNARWFTPNASLGCYLPTTYQAVKEIAYDTEHFSSRRIIVRDVRPETLGTAPPITSDPPVHKPAKQLLLPPFTPDAMKKLSRGFARSATN